MSKPPKINLPLFSIDSKKHHSKESANSSSRQNQSLPGSSSSKTKRRIADLKKRDTETYLINNSPVELSIRSISSNSKIDNISTVFHGPVLLNNTSTEGKSDEFSKEYQKCEDNKRSALEQFRANYKAPIYETVSKINTKEISLTIPTPIFSNEPFTSESISTDTATINPINLAKFQKIKDFVEDAVHDCKTFVLGGHPAVRKALMERGWIEKITITNRSPQVLRTAACMQLNQLVPVLENKEFGYIYTRVLKSKLLGGNQADFYWDPPRSSSLKTSDKPFLINHFMRKGEHDFTSKIGIVRLIRQLPSYVVPGLADVKYPPSFLLGHGEWEDFLKYFRITACLGMVKCFVSGMKEKQTVISDTGTIPLSALNFALLQIISYVKNSENVVYPVEVWSLFMDHFYQFVYTGDHFFTNKSETPANLLQQAEYTLSRAKQCRPDMEMEGMHNIWLLKPAGFNRGNGIYVCRRLDRIRQIVGYYKNLKYVIQKYIEKPFLIYDTKFDIRQWFLISRSSPLTVWMYKDCYLRFSSQPFDLTMFHESVHLTNNSIQRKYRNSSSRDSELPVENMWHSDEFKNYLKREGYTDAWDKIIYPRMKQAIMAVLLPYRKYIENEKNAFEMFGADFMLGSDFHPWLIEINSDPAMTHSTKITSNLCPLVIEDCIKVIIDKQTDPKAPPGRFDLVYKEFKP